SDGPVPVRRLHQPGVNVAPHAASLAASLRHCSERSSHLVECQVTEICEVVAVCNSALSDGWSKPRNGSIASGRGSHGTKPVALSAPRSDALFAAEVQFFLRF